MITSGTATGSPAPAERTRRAHGHTLCISFSERAALAGGAKIRAARPRRETGYAMTTDREADIARLMGLALGRDVAPGESLDMAAEAAWDSMKHIEIILTLEQGLGLSFAPEDIPRLTSMRLITDKVKELDAG